MARKSFFVLMILGFALWFSVPSEAGMARIKDITRFEGERGNQLIGYGLVVGLAGTGDSRNSLFTNQSLANMLQLLGITVDSQQIRARNVAGVIVTAELPPFIRPGETIDVMVSSLGDSRTLQGGVLLLTPLKAVDGNVYAVAQGSLSIGGFAAGGGGTQVQRNHPTVGKIPNGGIVERTVETRFYDTIRGTITLLLQHPDFVTATRIAQAISNEIGGRQARAIDANRVEITIPEQYAHRVSSLMALMGEIPVMPDTPARVVVNERTGTVVIGGNVRVLPVALSHGNLTITVRTRFDVSQPLPFSLGQTVVVPETDIVVEEDDVGLYLIEGTTTIDDLVMSMNALGVSPRDLIAILQGLKRAGALQGELIIE